MNIVLFPIAVVFVIVVTKITTSINNKRKHVHLIRILVITFFLAAFAAIVYYLPNGY